MNGDRRKAPTHSSPRPVRRVIRTAALLLELLGIPALALLIIGTSVNVSVARRFVERTAPVYWTREERARAGYDLAETLAAAEVVVFLGVGAWAALKIRKAVRRMEPGLAAVTEAHELWQVTRWEELARVVQDLAERTKQAEEGIAAQRGQFDALLSAMPVGLIHCDDRGRILRVTSVAGDWLGVGEGAVGRSLILGTRIAALDRVFRAVVTGEENSEEEFEVGPAPGARTVRVRGHRLQGADYEQGGVALVLEDRTELRRLERVRQDFVANASHELRGPVTSLRAAAETLAGVAEHDLATRQQFGQMILREADRLSALVSDLLDLSRLERPEPLAEWISVDLVELVGAVVDQYRSEAEQKEIVLDFVPDAEELPAPCSPADLSRAVANLLDNALKYTEPGGRVETRVMRTPEGGRIDVSDTGLGIAKGHLARIFERFYRVDKARSRRLGGTGLGLSIARHVVELHGGRVEVESEPGRGSTFTILLPLPS